MIQLTVNNEVRQVDVEPDTPLLWVLRDTLGLTGTRFSCGAGLCGACTVHLNGEAIRSCILPISAVAGANITTIEGLAPPGKLHPVQKAWLDHSVPQCGYCQSGQIMASAALLSKRQDYTEETLGASLTNLCRCTTYQRIRKAFLAAQGTMAAPGAVSEAPAPSGTEGTSGALESAPAAPATEAGTAAASPASVPPPAIQWFDVPVEAPSPAPSMKEAP